VSEIDVAIRTELNPKDLIVQDVHSHCRHTGAQLLSLTARTARAIS
jgi:hypothetical protein